MESQQKFRSLQNTSVGSQPNGAAISPNIPIYFEKEVIDTFNARLSLCTGYGRVHAFRSAAVKILSFN